MREALAVPQLSPKLHKVSSFRYISSLRLYDLTCGHYHEAVLAKVPLAAGLRVSINRRHWYRSESMMRTCAQTSSRALEAERG